MKDQRAFAVRAVFGLLSLVVGVGGAVYAYRETSSWALAVFVALIAMSTIGRGVADVITDPDKGRRAAYFGIPPAAAVGVLVLARALWGTWWLAVVLGFVAWVFGSVIVTVALPRVAAEEYEDSLERGGVRRVRRENYGMEWLRKH